MKAPKAYPAFTLFAVATLALSVGANVAVFSLVNAIWLKPRPIVEPDRVVLVSMMNDRGGDSEPETSEFGRQRISDLPAFESAAGQVAAAGPSASKRPRIELPAVPRALEVTGVTWQFFHVTGLTIRGRDFTAADDAPGAPAVAIISHRLWRQAFDESPALVGADVDASPIPLRIVGVAPEGFHGFRLGEQTDIWIPRHLVPRVSASGSIARVRDRPAEALGLLVFARLRPGLPLRDAQQQVSTAIGRRLLPLNSLYGTSANRTIVIGQSAAVWMAAMTAALVLLAGSATLMALVVVHFERRRQELAVRAALGCSAARMVAMLVAELAVVAGAGLAGALVAGATMLRLLPALRLPGGLELARLDIGIDWRVLVAGAGIAATAIALGAITPIRRVLAQNVSAELGVVSGRATASSFTLRSGAVVFHVAATVVVMVAAGLFVRTVVNGLSDAPGFDVHRTLFVQVTTRLSDERAQESAVRIAGDIERLEQLRDRLAALPGVQAMSSGSAPINTTSSGEEHMWALWTNGRAVGTFVPSVKGVDPSYFDVLGLRLLAGRGLTPADIVANRDGAVGRSAVVTRALSDRLWPGTTPLGQSFGLAGTRWSYHVVGVVEDHVMRTLNAPHRMGVYFAEDSASAAGRFQVELAIRSDDPDALVDVVRRTTAQVFPRGMDIRVATGRDLVRGDLGGQRLAAWLFSGFGIISVVIGLGGIFGLVGYLAESRRREMGIRLALGAKPSQILRTLLGAGLLPVIGGVMAGIVASGLLARVIESRLVGVTGTDPLTYGSVTAVVLVPAALAALAAAWRIRRVSPSEILRAE